MSTRDDSGVSTSAGIPAIIFACVLGALSAFAFGFARMFNAALEGTGSVLTLPNSLILGVCFGASAGGLVALLCGCHLRRGFCCLFGAALGGIVCMILSVVFVSTRHDPHQLLKDAIVLGGIVFLGGVGGTAARRFVTRFGAKSRAWARIGAGTSAGIAFPLVAAILYANMNAVDFVSVREELLQVLAIGFGWALIAAFVVGWISALAGAIRDSVEPSKMRTAERAA